MKRYLILILFLIVVSANGSPLKIKLDGAVFRNDSLTNALELYYSFRDNSLRYYYDAGNYKAECLMLLKISSQGKVLDSVTWIVPLQTKQIVLKDSAEIVGIKSLRIKHGSYDLVLTASDKNDPANKITKTLFINSRGFDTKKIILSDIQIASQIEQQDSVANGLNPSFIKNSLFVFPNPGAEIFGFHPVINSYIEIYNSKTVCPEGLKLTYLLFDGSWSEVYRFYRNINSVSDGQVEYISLPMDAMPSGVYFLKILAESNQDGKQDTASALKKIYIINFEFPAKPMTDYRENREYEMSEFVSMTEEQADIAFEQSKCRASEYERDVYEKITTIEGKKRYLFAFWLKRNDDTTKPYNVAFENFKELIEFANKNFSSGNIEGWKSDRGRVLLKYGHPTVINTTPQKGNLRAYQVWLFDEIQGGVEFDFVDMYGTGNSIMVNSTANGRARFYYWKERYIYKYDPLPNGTYPPIPEE